MRGRFPRSLPPAFTFIDSAFPFSLPPSSFSRALTYPIPRGGRVLVAAREPTARGAVSESSYREGIPPCAKTADLRKLAFGVGCFFPGRVAVNSPAESVSVLGQGVSELYVIKGNS